MKDSVTNILDPLKASTEGFSLDTQALRAEADESLDLARGLGELYDHLVKMTQQATRELPWPEQLRQELMAQTLEAQKKLHDLKRTTMLDVQSFLSERYVDLK